MCKCGYGTDDDRFGKATGCLISRLGIDSSFCLDFDFDLRDGIRRICIDRAASSTHGLDGGQPSSGCCSTN